MNKYYTLEVHHGGFFVEQPKKAYVWEKVSYVDNIDLDKMPLFELQYILEELGIDKRSTFYYRIPDCDLGTGLIIIENDVGVLGVTM